MCVVHVSQVNGRELRESANGIGRIKARLLLLLGYQSFNEGYAQVSYYFNIFSFLPC